MFVLRLQVAFIWLTGRFWHHLSDLYEYGSRHRSAVSASNCKHTHQYLQRLFDCFHYDALFCTQASKGQYH